jgi:O-antigen ligase
VSARFDYWRAAVQTTSDKPLFGTGPGTFAIAYQQRKRPESEMSRMVHNDYLEQASDSGVIGFLGYALFIGGGLLWSYPRLKTLPQIGTKPKSTSDWQPFLLWLGVLGWSLQSLLEFGLYIPALAWPAHAFLGWLLARRSNP